MKTKKKILALFLILIIFTPVVGLAQTNPCAIQANQPTQASALPQCVNQVYVWSLGVGALLALLMLIIGGYYYMTAAGNAERSSKGTSIIWSSIIGLALLFGAYLLLNTINPDLVNFSSFTNDMNCLSSSSQTVTGTPSTSSSTCAGASSTTTPAPHN